jgi:hypothetical protein
MPTVTQIPTRTQVEDRVMTVLLGDVAIGDDEEVEQPSILFRPTHVPSLFGNSSISGTHNSWLLPIRVNRKGLLTYPIGCHERWSPPTDELSATRLRRLLEIGSLFTWKGVRAATSTEEEFYYVMEDDPFGRSPKRIYFIPDAKGQAQVCQHGSGSSVDIRRLEKPTWNMN